MLRPYEGRVLPLDQQCLHPALNPSFDGLGSKYLPRGRPEWAGALYYTPENWSEVR